VQVPREGAIHRRSVSSNSRLNLYFTSEEHELIDTLVDEKKYDCKGHDNCTDCRNIEYAYHQNKIMNTAIPPEERAKVINNNRSLRTIKNELENLLENGMISDEAYDSIMNTLPSESSLKAPGRNAVCFSKY